MKKPSKKTTIDELDNECVSENVDENEVVNPITEKEIIETEEVKKTDVTGDTNVNEIADNIPDEIRLFAENNYKDLIEASIPYYPGLASNNVDEYYLKDAYVVYDYNHKNPEIYYYPISLDEKIVMVLSVVNTSDGLTISSSAEMVDGLNRIHYAFYSDDIVFYENGNAIEA